MMPYMRNGTHNGMRRMKNSNKSNQIPGHGLKIIDVEKINLLSTDSKLASVPYITDSRVFDGRSTRA